MESVEQKGDREEKLFPYLGEVLGHRAHKRLGILGGGNFTLQDLCAGVGHAIERPRGIRIFGHHSSGKVDAGKKSLGAGIGEQLGVKLPVGRSLGVAAYGARRGRGVAADLELVLQAGPETPYR